MDSASILNTAGAIRDQEGSLGELSMTVGFDGFVDEMIQVVGTRASLDSFTPVPDISAFASEMAAAAGHSTLREIVVNKVDPGGCAVNLGDGLLTLGVTLDCFATLGEPIHPAFEDFVSRCRVAQSWGKEPGRTLAFEFSDGKLMFSSVKQLADFKPATLQPLLDTGAYAKSCGQAEIVALTDWSLYPHMTEVWRFLQRKVYGSLGRRPTFFIDLVDPSSRSDVDIMGMIDALAGFSQVGRCILGLNGNEANILSRLLGLPPGKDEVSSAKEQARLLRAQLGIDDVVVHWVKVAVAADSDGVAGVEGPYCAKPVKLTGAGDRFNAGYCLGKLLGFEQRERLLTGAGSSGFFVRNARSANRRELVQFLEDWGNDLLVD